MPRPRKKAYTKKERVGITPDPVIMNWVLERVGPGKRFHNITHGFESGVAALMEMEAKEHKEHKEHKGK